VGAELGVLNVFLGTAVSLPWLVLHGDRFRKLDSACDAAIEQQWLTWFAYEGKLLDYFCDSHQHLVLLSAFLDENRC
jgi:hypothetical protein